MTDDPNNGSRRQADLIIAKIEGKVDLLVTTVMEIRTWLMGDGTPSNPGVMIRLDRLEQIEKGREDDAKNTKAWRLGLLASIILLWLERSGHYLLAWISKASHGP